MPDPNLSSEQTEHWQKHVAGIGHNRGPELVAHGDEIVAKAERHRWLSRETTGIRVMLDMLRSDLAGEYVLPAKTTIYVCAGLMLVAVVTGVSIPAEPVAGLLLDAPVIAAILAALHGEMDGYVDWRAARDPSYAAIKQALTAKR